MSFAHKQKLKLMLLQELVVEYKFNSNNLKQSVVVGSFEWLWLVLLTTVEYFCVSLYLWWTMDDGVLNIPICYFVIGAKSVWDLELGDWKSGLYWTLYWHLYCKTIFLATLRLNVPIKIIILQYLNMDVSITTNY